MKTHITNLVLLPALIAGLGLILADRVTAQTFTVLHSFTAVNNNYSGYLTNSDGANPAAGLITNSSGNTLYGTADAGGSSGQGTVFAVNTDGTGFTNLHSFAGSDGAYPSASLILSGNTLYGTTRGGTVFAVNTDGTGFTNLPSFLGENGGAPYAGLILSGNTLYGTTYAGGSSLHGTIFAINTNGTSFTNLYSFSAFDPDTFTNSDGVGPYAGLILSGNTLYGTTGGGGSSGYGTVFKVNTNGTGFTTLHSFSALPGPDLNSTNSDGANPLAALILSGNTLYGTAYYGGSSGYGTVFALNTDGTSFTTLHSFTAYDDGANPRAGLTLLGNTLYGTTAPYPNDFGPPTDVDTVFAVNTDGTGFTTLHRFPGGSLFGGLIVLRNSLYGTSANGGSSHNGTVFSLSFTPQLTITHSEANVILTWPTNVAGFDYTGYTLQSTTNLVSPTVWTTNSPAPVVADGQNTVTNPISAPQQFYRLIQ